MISQREAARLLGIRLQELRRRALADPPEVPCEWRTMTLSDGRTHTYPAFHRAELEAYMLERARIAAARSMGQEAAS